MEFEIAAKSHPQPGDDDDDDSEACDSANCDAADDDGDYSDDGYDDDDDDGRMTIIIVIPLSWALEAGCRILVFRWSSVPRLGLKKGCGSRATG